MNPPLRTEHDVEALIAGVADGTITILGSDHAPHCPHEKEVEFDQAPFGILGLETELGLFLDILVHKKKAIDLPRLIACSPPSRPDCSASTAAPSAPAPPPTSLSSIPTASGPSINTPATASAATPPSTAGSSKAAPSARSSPAGPVGPSSSDRPPAATVVAAVPERGTKSPTTSAAFALQESRRTFAPSAVANSRSRSVYSLIASVFVTSSLKLTRLPDWEPRV